MSESRPRTSPTATADRLVVLDVLRGFALFGVFLVNVGYTCGVDLEGQHDRADALASILLRGLFETKFVTIFSLLFGMGLVLQVGRARAKGVPMTVVYLRRLTCLCVMGLAHGYLLFAGDILFLYSLAGLVLFCFHRASPRVLAILALVPLAVGLVLGVAFAGLDDHGPGLFETIYYEIGRRSVVEGPLALTLSFRAVEFWVLQIAFTVTSFNWRVLAMFFLGAAAMKRDLLDEEHRRLHGFLAVLLGTLGLALEALVFLTPWNDDWTSPRTVLAHEIGSIVLGFGYVALVAWVVHGGMLQWLMLRLAAVGRLALTNYLAQSVLMNFLFTWLGLGLWGALPLWASLVLVVPLFGLQIVLSVWWTRTRGMGPMERLWRTATYGRRPA